MGRVSAVIEIAAPLADVWDSYFDQGGWSSWVDGFAAVTTAPGYPERGGTLQWRSTPAGRGVVSERVLEHEPRRCHRISFDDDYASGEQTTRFEIASGGGSRAETVSRAAGQPELASRAEGSFAPASPAAGSYRTSVGIELNYALRSPGLLGPITDPVFVRPQMRRSLTRTLERLRGEIEGRLTSSLRDTGSRPVDRPIA